MKKVFGLVLSVIISSQSLFSQGLEIGGGADLVMYKGNTSFSPRVSLFYPELLLKKKLGFYGTVNFFPGNRLVDNLGVTYKINDKFSAYYGRAIFDMMTPRPELFPFTGRQDLGISYYPTNSPVSIKAGWAFWLGPTAQVTFRLKEIFPGDTDKDGVNDKKDKCPNTPEKYVNNVDVFGCPMDTDGDGVFDLDDECPKDAGLAALNGCPDADGDGIANAKDNCPEVAGIAKFNGCPDTDEDGIMDSEDNCPEIAGLTEFKGCPDTDGDGIMDSEDDCPTEAGDADNSGCPKAESIVVDSNNRSQELYAQISRIAEASIIFFDFNKSTTSEIELEKTKILIDFLKANKSATVTLVGHADSRGTEEINIQISDRRASYYAKQLTKNGIERNRMKFYGVGEVKPIFDEDEKNRCVEVRISID